jgi:GH24 family phage-related lysozyme (muramidase)
MVRRVMDTATSYQEQSANQLRIFEATIPWMYLDTRGNVTAGVGVMLPSAADALKLPWIDVKGNPASAFDVTEEFLRVQKMLTGRSAQFYYLDTAPKLALTEISHMLDATVSVCEGELAKTFDKYAQFPVPAKLALIDMVYNLGLEKLKFEYIHFCTAVGRMDWETAAANCHRNGPGDSRNEWTKQQFLDAATEVG